MNQISECCRASIGTGTKLEYPLGGSTWYESFEVTYCESCGMEDVVILEVTECCGEVTCTCIEDELEALRIAGASS